MWDFDKRDAVIIATMFVLLAVNFVIVGKQLEKLKSENEKLSAQQLCMFQKLQKWLPDDCACCHFSKR